MKSGDLVAARDDMWVSIELWAQKKNCKEHSISGRLSDCDVAIVLCVEEEEVKVLTNRGAIGWTLNFRLKRVEQ